MHPVLMYNYSGVLVVGVKKKSSVWSGLHASAPLNIFASVIQIFFCVLNSGDASSTTEAL